MVYSRLSSKGGAFETHHRQDLKQLEDGDNSPSSTQRTEAAMREGIRHIAPGQRGGGSGSPPREVYYEGGGRRALTPGGGGAPAFKVTGC